MNTCVILIDNILADFLGILAVYQCNEYATLHMTLPATNMPDFKAPP